MTLGWLAERLAMRSAANVSQQLRRASAGKIDRKLSKRLATFVHRAMEEEWKTLVEICTLTPIVPPSGTIVATLE